MHKLWTLEDVKEVTTMALKEIGDHRKRPAGMLPAFGSLL
jgi:hypothetical protein